MGNYLFSFDGGWILVHEIFSRPHNVIGYSNQLTEEQARKAIELIEDELGCGLEQKDELDAMTDEDMEDYYPKIAGFDFQGRFVAQ